MPRLTPLARFAWTAQPFHLLPVCCCVPRVVRQKLTKNITKSVENEMKERASSLGQGFKILPALDNGDEDLSKKHTE